MSVCRPPAALLPRAGGQGWRCGRTPAFGVGTCSDETTGPWETGPRPPQQPPSPGAAHGPRRRGFAPSSPHSALLSPRDAASTQSRGAVPSSRESRRGGLPGGAPASPWGRGLLSTAPPGGGRLVLNLPVPAVCAGPGARGQWDGGPGGRTVGFLDRRTESPFYPFKVKTGGKSSVTAWNRVRAEPQKFYSALTVQ